MTREDMEMARATAAVLAHSLAEMLPRPEESIRFERRVVEHLLFALCDHMGGRFVKEAAPEALAAE